MSGRDELANNFFMEIVFDGKIITIIHSPRLGNITMPTLSLKCTYVHMYLCILYDVVYHYVCQLMGTYMLVDHFV